MINYIKAYRINAGLSQSEFANKIGVSKNSISLYETGQSIPSVEVALKIYHTLCNEDKSNIISFEDIFSLQNQNENSADEDIIGLDMQNDDIRDEVGNPALMTDNLDYIDSDLLYSNNIDIF